MEWLALRLWVKWQRRSNQSSQEPCRRWGTLVDGSKSFEARVVYGIFVPLYVLDLLVHVKLNMMITLHIKVSYIKYVLKRDEERSDLLNFTSAVPSNKYCVR